MGWYAINNVGAEALVAVGLAGSFSRTISFCGEIIRLSKSIYKKGELVPRLEETATT